MGCRYLLLPDAPGRIEGPPAADLPLRLRDLGLDKRPCGKGLTLYASAGTPTFRFPDGTTVIGHLFLRDGTPLGDAADLASPTAPSDARSAILDRCWGEYVLLQPARDNAAPATVLRDPSGGVACVYHVSPGTAFITSDISIATRLGLYDRRVDWDFVAHFLAYPYIKAQRTGLCGIRELLPGCVLHLGRTGVAVAEPAWSPWGFMAHGRRHTAFDEAATALRSVVERTVGAWADTDGNALIELSGGLDSSIVATCLRDKAATVGCATLVPELPGADERAYASAVARALGAELHIETLSVDAARFDAPVPPECVVPGPGPLQVAVDGIMEAVASREGYDCFYSGGGGDTVFSFLGGAAPATDACLERGPIAGMQAAWHLAELHRCTFWRAAGLALRKLAPNRRHPFPLPDTSLLRPSRLPHAPDPHPWSEAPHDALPGDRERADGLAGIQLFRDLVPRGTKRWYRLPLMSQPVMETCLSIPTWMWVEGGRNRAVARRAFADVLPPRILYRRSKGSFSQYNGAVYRRNRDATRRCLLDGRLHAQGLLDADALSAFFDRPLAPRDRSFMRIVDLCRAERWVRRQS